MYRMNDFKLKNEELLSKSAYLQFNLTDND